MSVSLRPKYIRKRVWYLSQECLELKPNSARLRESNQLFLTYAFHTRLGKKGNRFLAGVYTRYLMELLYNLRLKLT